MARPSTYTSEIADRICEEMISGRDLVSICSDADMPSRSSVYRWMDDVEGFGTRCARAREGLGDYAEHVAYELAMASTPETAQADRIKVSAAQWRASKLNHRRYGDKIQQEHSGPDGGPIKTENITDEDRARALAAFLARTSAKAG